MARMIPATIYRGCASPGEREIFQRLRDDELTKDWIVLHSLDIAEHRRQVSGEADFVVIVPEKGVLCLEVKASSSVTRASDGLWYYGRQSQGDPRGPFRQASAAMYSIREFLLKTQPALSQIFFWSAVAFPYVSFTATSNEWHSWQVIDRQIFTSRPLSKSIELILDRGKSHLETHSSYKLSAGVPTLDQCEAIGKILRPRFEFVESSKSHAERLKAELKKYTEEQFVALDAMVSNPRVAFEGPAGTGKTMLAVEAARRAAAEDRHVLLLCFNRILGNWLQQETASLRPNVVSQNLHRHMLRVAKIDREADVTDQTFWEVTLPQRAIEQQIEKNGSELCFDEIIIDEAQDILRDEYLDFLDLSLKGGLAAGRWRMFGDFEKQAIYGAANLSLHTVLDRRAAGTPIYSLRVNCRNPPRIAETTRLLAGLNPFYSRILRPDNGAEPKINYYRSEAEQKGLLCTILGVLNKEGFENDDIVILSTRSDTYSISSRIDNEPWKNCLRPFNSVRKGNLRYGSVHGFKGMEAAAVIVTDVDRITDQAASSLFYVAITRAVDRLVLLVDDSVREDIVRALI